MEINGQIDAVKEVKIKLINLINFKKGVKLMKRKGTNSQIEITIWILEIRERFPKSQVPSLVFLSPSAKERGPIADECANRATRKTARIRRPSHSPPSYLFERRLRARDKA